MVMVAPSPTHIQVAQRLYEAHRVPGDQKPWEHLSDDTQARWVTVAKAAAALLYEQAADEVWGFMASAEDCGKQVDKMTMSSAVVHLKRLSKE
jgi:hypothetical protein